MDKYKSSADPNHPHAALDQFKAHLTNFAAAWEMFHPELNPPGGDKSDIVTQTHYKPAATSLEKMGFVMGGNISNPLHQVESLLGKILDKLPPKGSTPTLADLPGLGWLGNQL
jgi:hypothetical protein